MSDRKSYRPASVARIRAGIGLFEPIADILRVLDDAVHDHGRVFGLSGQLRV